MLAKMAKRKSWITYGVLFSALSRRGRALSEVNNPASSARFWAAALFLLGAMAAVQVVTVREESQTYDESNQLLSGYTYLTTGRISPWPSSSRRF